jgi:hypothetical protein
MTMRTNFIEFSIQAYKNAFGAWFACTVAKKTLVKYSMNGFQPFPILARGQMRL